MAGKASPVAETPTAYSASAGSSTSAQCRANNAGTALDAIGGTPVVELARLVPSGSARVLMKLELANPTGSMKDRVAAAMVRAALADGRLEPGGTVVEYTGGTTGVSLAFVCAALGLKAHLVSSDAFSAEKLAMMRAFGADLTIVPSQDRRIDHALIKAMIQRACELADRPGHWMCNQLDNPDGEHGYHALGEELWTQSGGQIDAFVQAVGSAHSLNGTVHALRRHHPNLIAVAAEPAETPVLSGGTPGPHRIEGIGIGFIPPLWRPTTVQRLESATTDEANQMARRLAREEGILAGTSTGLNLITALRVARDLGPGRTVTTLAIDTGQRYLSTEPYKP